MIGPASRQDLAEILKIYNEVIRNSTAVYTEVELSAERGDAWFTAKRSGGFPFIVARDASGITGFGTFSEFRAPPCYQHSVEHSVHVRCDQCEAEMVVVVPFVVGKVAWIDVRRRGTPNTCRASKGNIIDHGAHRRCRKATRRNTTN